jgi:hypothetical protein
LVGPRPFPPLCLSQPLSEEKGHNDRTSQRKPPNKTERTTKNMVQTGKVFFCWG